MGVPSFLVRLPERQSDLQVSDAGLGLVLAGFAVGALVASPLAGWLATALGSDKVTTGSGLLLAGALWTAGAAPTSLVLFVALVLIGAADAAMDTAMNTNGAAYEAATGRSALQRLHGAWSLGALLAAAGAGLAVAVDCPLTVHLLAVGALSAALVLGSRTRLVHDVPTKGRSGSAEHHILWRPALPEANQGEPRTARPRTARARAGRRRRRISPPLAALAVAVVVGALVESAPSDWAAIQLERYGTGRGTAVVGLAAFMAGMLVGRLGGDALTDRFGRIRVLRAGMALTALGIAAGAVAGQPVIFTVGLVLAGLGSAGFFPLAFSAAARTDGVAPGTGAAIVALAARLGFLVAPILIGGVADLTSLRLAFGLVAAVAAGLALAAPWILPDRPGHRT